MGEDIIKITYELTKKHMNAEGIDFKYKIIRQYGPPQFQKKDEWIISIPQARLPDEDVLNLSLEFSHVFHHYLSRGAYIQDAPSNFKDVVKDIEIKEITEEEIEKGMIEHAREACWVEGLTNRVAEFNLAFYTKIDKYKVRNTLEKIIETSEIILPMEQKYADWKSIGADEIFAVVNAFRATIIERYAHIIGYVGTRDLPEMQFYNLLKQEDAHKDDSLLWNRGAKPNERHQILKMINKSDAFIKNQLNKIPNTDFKHIEKIRNLLIKNLVK